jgi:serine phosphatase RsbU (regulator of sigma subunit)
MQIDSAQGNYKQALEHYKLAIIYRDSIENKENTKRIVEAQMNYEFDKKQIADNLKVSADKKVLHAQIAQQKTQRNGFVMGFALVLLFAGFIFRNYKEKQKANLLLEEKNKLIEYQKSQTKQSIEYALHIQESILPDKEHINESFPNSFILYKPKDIVSGDFYAFARQENEILIAAADCTGHGVPGALMSMLGSNILYQIINEKNILKPSEILFHLNIGITESLKQNKNAGNDGMDISICSFNNNVLQYSGAYRPLYLIRNGELIEVKATKMAIGGQQNDQQRIYENHELELQKGDTIYLSTDGYADQFGGDTGEKKLTKKRFKDLILSIQSKTLQEQGIALDKFITAYRKEIEQIDDILVIGVQI